MNLNLNRRLETVEISDDPAMADYLGAVVDEAFAATTGAATVAAAPTANQRALDHLGKTSDTASGLAALSGDGPYARDVRRTGVHFA